MRLKSVVRLIGEFTGLSRRRRVGIFRDKARNSDVVCLPCQTVLDACSSGIPDRLDGALHLDGHQLLEAVEDGAAICRACKGDGFVPGSTRPQRHVVTSVLRLARDQNGTLAVIPALLVAISATIVTASRVDRGAAWLLAPYLAWDPPRPQSMLAWWP